MPGDAGPAEPDPTVQVRRDLQLARSEISWILGEHEHMSEALQRVRRQRARLREQSEALAAALAAELSASYWREQESVRGRLRRRDADADLVREVESSAHFDAGWYLRQNQAQILEQHLAPALHHVRQGNARRLDPSEDFDTKRYLLRHPEAAASGVPALVHAERNGHLDDGLVALEVAED